MTRFARYGHKKVHDATPWSGLKAGTAPTKEPTKAERALEKRRERRKKNKPCFNCRSTGHLSANCPEQGEKGENGKTICYRCGSSDHGIHACKKKIQQGDPEFPFATCFICKQKGHLTRSCPDNPRGLYPNGGSCNVCGSVEHLRTNCPDKMKEKRNNNINISTIDVNAAGDDDDIHESFMQKKNKRPASNGWESIETEDAEESTAVKKPKKKVKIVKM
eukprot:CFRG6982T1